MLMAPEMTSMRVKIPEDDPEEVSVIPVSMKGPAETYLGGNTMMR